MSTKPRRHSVYWLLLIAMLLTAVVYWPGLSGGWLFDDYPNIVDNPGVQPQQLSVPALISAALSSPASSFKRPLASLSFAANYLASGLNPWPWKLTNLVLHLCNGVLVFLLARTLLRRCASEALDGARDKTAVLIAAAWMLLPINLTAVLYVVQREESMANLFVLLGLIGYVTGRQQMIASGPHALVSDGKQWRGFAVCIVSLVIPTAIGLLAKETAVMLPLYAVLIEWIVFHFRRPIAAGLRKDWRIAGLFTVVLLLPMIIGTAWLLPNLLNPANWASRDFTLSTRLLSEARILCSYIVWTVLPTPSALSFYHDQFRVSTGLFSPWTTLGSILTLIFLVIAVFRLRHRQPLAALGLGLYLGCHLLTSTIVPLELVYEHRNYFASFGILLAAVPLLTGVPSGNARQVQKQLFPLAPLGKVLLVCLLLWWTALTAITATAWGDPLRQAQELASRAPDSPRAEYELGRTYIIYSHYDPMSPYTKLAYAPLERAAALPASSILPQQALIFMNSRMHLPIKDAWWDSMISKLKTRVPGVQDESSLLALTQCARDDQCALPTFRMIESYKAALSHPNPSARLLAGYSDYAWNILDDHELGLRMAQEAIKTQPNETAYRITSIRMLAALGQKAAARSAIKQLEHLNYGGRLDSTLAELRAMPSLQ